jgi:hypothetical protein
MTDIGSELARLWGEDARWIADNPPPAPLPVNLPEDPGTWTPDFMAAQPAKSSMTYSDFLKGRKSTGALARQWDSAYNYGRRFGGQ